MHSTRELGTQWKSTAVAVSTPTPELGVIESMHETMQVTTLPKALAMCRRWALTYSPAGLTINLRPGLPCWLGYEAIRRGWPLTVICTRAQLEKAPGDIQVMLFDVWYAAQRVHMTTTTMERDQLIRDTVPVLGLGDVSRLRVPIMDDVVLLSGANDRTATEGPDHARDYDNVDGDEFPSSAG